MEEIVKDLWWGQVHRMQGDNTYVSHIRHVKATSREEAVRKILGAMAAEYPGDFIRMYDTYQGDPGPYPVKAF